jgi:ABC-type sugar transport system ATPase subunit
VPVNRPDEGAVGGLSAWHLGRRNPLGWAAAQAQSISDTEAAGIVIIHQELTLVPDLSVAENIFMGHELTLPGGRMNYPAMIHRAEALMRELKCRT